MAKFLVISKAEPADGQSVEDVQIVITGNPPGYAEARETAAALDKESTELAEVLFEALPLGTLYALSQKLTARRKEVFGE